MTETIGLSDIQRFWFELAIGMIGAAQAFLISESLSGNTAIPTMVIFYLNLIIAVLAPIKAILGVRDASTAKIARTTDPNLDQFRKIPPQTTKP